MSPDAFPAPMAENLSPQQAARVLAEASRYEDGLQHRTEGLTFIIWGLATSAMFVSYGFASLLDAPWPVFALLWAPWVLAGLAATFALWRSAALTVARPSEAPTGRDWLVSFGATIAMGAVYALVRPDGPVVPLGLLGIFYLVLFGLNPFGTSRTGRALGLACGALFGLAAAALALTGAPIAVSGLVGIVLPGVALIGGGLWQTLRS